VTSAVTAGPYRGSVPGRRGAVRTVVKIAVGVILAVLLLGAGCAALLGSASYDASVVLGARR
jgi:hypothetical protein